MCPRSYALGHWRGAMGRPLAVPLAESVCRSSYAAGHFGGQVERAERDAARRTKGRR